MQHRDLILAALAGSLLFTGCATGEDAARPMRGDVSLACFAAHQAGSDEVCSEEELALLNSRQSPAREGSLKAAAFDSDKDGYDAKRILSEIRGSDAASDAKTAGVLRDKSFDASRAFRSDIPAPAPAAGSDDPKALSKPLRHNKGPDQTVHYYMHYPSYDRFYEVHPYRYYDSPASGVGIYIQTDL